MLPENDFLFDLLGVFFPGVCRKNIKKRDVMLMLINDADDDSDIKDDESYDER